MHKYSALLAVAAMLAMQGCDKGETVEPPPPPPPPPSELDYTITVSDITQTAATVGVVPTKDDVPNSDVPYYFDLVLETDLDDMDGDVETLMNEFVEFMLEDSQLDRSKLAATIRSKGPASDRIEGLPAGTAFYVFAIGLDDECNTVLPYRVERFKTLPAPEPPDPSKCTFQIAVSELTMTSARMSVTPSDDTVPYFFALVPSSEYQGDAQLVDRIYGLFVEMAGSYGLSVAEVVEMVSSYGPDADVVDELKPDTRHMAFAFALKPDGSAAGAVKAESFSTPAANESSVTVTVSAPKYYDGDALYAADPTIYPNSRGKVYIPVAVTPSEDAVHWWVGLAKGDLSMPELFTDEMAITALVDRGGGIMDKRNVNFNAEWGTVTLLALAADRYNIPGKVFRSVLDTNKSGASPVSDIVGGRSSMPAWMSITTDMYDKPSCGVLSSMRSGLRLPDSGPQPSPKLRRGIGFR